MKKIFLSLTLVIAGGLCSTANAQNEELTVFDAVTSNGGELRPQSIKYTTWIPGSDQFVKIVDQNLIAVNASNLEESNLISLEEINTILAESNINEIASIPYYKWINNNEFYFRASRGIVTLQLDKKSAQIIEIPGTAENVSYNATSGYIAYTSNQALYVTNGEEPKLVMAVKPGYTIGQFVHRNEFGIEKGIFWSNNGNKLAFYTNNESNVTDYTLLNYNNVPATTNVIKYPMAGQSNEEVMLFSYDISTAAVQAIETSADVDKTYLTNVSWTEDDQSILIAQLNRDQNNMDLNQYDAATGKLEGTILNESSNAYVQPMHPAINIGNNEVIWRSQKGGLDQMYVVNLQTKTETLIDTKDLIVREIIKVDTKNKVVYISANDKNAIDLKIYKVEYKKPANAKVKEITKAEGVHRGFTMNDQMTYGLDKYSSLNNPGKVDVVKLSNGAATNVLTSTNPLQDYKVGTVELVTFGKENMPFHGRIIKPSDYDPSKKYPVLLYVYNGPNVQLVTNSWLGAAPLWMLNMAERGYIIWTVDGRGSNNRGLAFEQNIYRQLGVNEMADQVEGINYLKTIASIDENRIAVHGWSYGGYMTISLLENYADVFNAGVAGGPVTDWKFYEVMYGERYMDTPESNPQGYEETSTLNKTSQIKDPLMLIHGTSDPVVVMQHSMAFLKSCVDNKVQVDFFAYPGHEHNVRGYDRVHLITKVLNYIEEKNQ